MTPRHLYCRPADSECGEGALRVCGRTVDYHSTATASCGFQQGTQAKSIVVLFTKESAPKKFLESEGWKARIHRAEQEIIPWVAPLRAPFN